MRWANGIVSDWSKTEGIVSYSREQLFDKSTKIFTLGSCFARVVRAILGDRGYDVYPKYKTLKLTSGQQAGKLPEKDNIHQYTPQTMLQELRLAKSGAWLNDFWQQPDGRWVDPCRRGLYGATRDDIADLTKRVNDLIIENYAACDLVLLTFGLIENWHIKETAYSGGYTAIDGEMYAERQTFSAHACAAMDTVESVMMACQPKRVIASVSPVPLRHTFTYEDVVVANMMSKSTLRAAVGMACRGRWGTYWPSYEYVMTHSDAWKENRIHPKIEVVHEIVDAFVAAHGTPGDDEQD